MKARLSALEKSHLVTLVRKSVSAAYTHQARTTEDFKALARLVKLGYIKVATTSEGSWYATERGKKFCRKGENMFSREQIAILRMRIKSGKHWVPKPSDLIYTQTCLYLDHGEDDVIGGLAQVTRVYRSMSGGDPRCVFLEVAQHDHGGNWTQFLYEDQKELMEAFGTQVSFPDPDVRPSSNEGWR